MNFLDAMQSRYTTKAYDSTQKLSSDQISELQEILRLSPSSINSQPWKFVFMSDAGLKNELAAVSIHNKQRIEDSSHLVVFMTPATPEQFESEMDSYLSEGGVGYYEKNKKPRGDEYLDAWFSSQVYISLGVFLSACAAMEIDATPMEGIEHSEYDRILKIEGYRTVVVAAIGTRDSEDVNQPSITPKRRRNAESIIIERS